MGRGVLLLLAVLVTACGGDDEGGSPAETGPHRIVVLGSSTAAGIGPSDPANTWVSRYRQHLVSECAHCELENLAVGGYTTYQIQPDDYAPPPNRPGPAAEHNITHALGLEPRSIVINLPSNDQFFGFTTAEQLENYERVAALAAERKVALWVTTSQPRNFAQQSQLDALFEARDAIAARFGDRSIDFWTDLAAPDGSILPELDSGDGIHLNDAAHAILADRVIAEDIPRK
ncbi:MAG: SGNH/GDSL hydrolase family protein [Polyangiaceae bacterium]|nr:SGNH/GDSL hydrolase family protein [Polyangiaceae bacterium]MCL4751728.1 SGNH/GDSL hydrolase family protein [Myxococcales bacterium]